MPAPQDILDAWLKTAPEHVQKLAAEFPIGCLLCIFSDADPWYVIGWTGDDHLIISPTPIDVNPALSIAVAHTVPAARYRVADT